MTITRKDVVAQLESSARVGYLKGMNSYVPKRSGFCGEVRSDKAFELYADM